jgi:hypothetical protein
LGRGWSRATPLTPIFFFKKIKNNFFKKFLI